MQAVTDAFRNALGQHLVPARAAHAQKFFKTGIGQYGEGDLFLGVSVPNQRAVAKAFWQPIHAKELAVLLADPYHEVRLTALFMLVEKFAKAKTISAKKPWADLYIQNLDYVNNWDLVDSSAHKILGPWLQDKPRDFLYELVQHENMWHKRIAIIATFCYIRQKDYKDALAIAEILLHHPHDLIHKAVGWMLREIGNRDLAAEEAFLQIHYRTMPRTALRYAIEKFEEPKRLDYLHGRI